MRFGILGSVEAWDGEGNPIAVGGPRVRSLLALLLLNAGKVVPVESLIDGLYGEDPPANAANALQSQVSRLRRGLGGAAEVELLPAGYRLVVDPDEVDAHRFERLVGEAGQDFERRAAALREALALWRGPALADVPEAESQAVRYEELRVSAIEDRAEADLSLGRHRELVAELQYLVDAYPLRERPRGLLMRALYGSGRQAEALEVYEEARRMLSEELGTDPSAELSAVHLAILRAEPEPVAGPGPVLKQLPAQLTSFIGRTDELTRIGRLLRSGRLVTLLGPGGAGKTRLSIEAGEQSEAEVCFVDLAPLGAGSEVPQAVMSALGLRETTVLPSAPGDKAPVDRLISALNGRRQLLILDNCEHVIADAARLVHRLLGSCPSLRILATSREPLSITGETICPVRQLPLPREGAELSEAADSPAVRLFADRAGAVRPDFAVTSANIEQIVRICGALDGQPLAIELAAARLRTLTVEDVAARLDDRFKLLSRGDRTKAPRHQTLRAVVEWSWGLLNEDEQELARRLTVFAGGATLQAAERICALDDVDSLLADLTDKSLVQQSDGRYKMLDTIRAFCAEQVTEQDQLRRAHATYFLEFATLADTHLRSSEQLEWLDLLTAEHGNFQVALRWSVQADPELALRLLAAVSPYWWLRGLRSEVAPLAAELLAKIGTTPPAGLQEEYVLCVANAVTNGRDEPGIAAHLEQAGEILNSIRQPLRQPFIHAIWAMAAGPPKDPAKIFEQRRQQFLDDPWVEALFHMGAGFLELFTGDKHEAEREMNLALQGFRTIGDRWGTTQTLDALAALADQRGDHDTATALLDEALALVKELGSVEDTADLLCRRGDGLLATDPAAAQASYEEAAKLASKAGAPTRLAVAHRGMGEVARLSGDLVKARRFHEIALDEIDSNWILADIPGWVLLGLGRIDLAEGLLADARKNFVDALSASYDFPRNLMLGATAVTCLAEVARAEGDEAQAALLRGAAAVLRGSERTETSAAYVRGAALSVEEIFALTGAEQRS